MFQYLTLEEWLTLGQKLDAELATYVVAFARIRRAEEALRKSGGTPPADRPSFLPSPHAAARCVLSDARNLLLGLATVRQRAEQYADLLDKKPGVAGALHKSNGPPPTGGGQAKPAVKLVGEDGGTYAILGRCRLAAQQAGWTQERIDKFAQKVLRAADYDDVLRACMEHFNVE